MNFFYKYIGLIFLILNCVRYRLFGYKNARPFSSLDFEKTIGYEKKVVKNWIRIFEEYSKQTIVGKSILEIGPGPDLGTGCLLLAKGASKYTTIDANELVLNVPRKFYEELLFEEQTKDDVLQQLDFFENNEQSEINYLVMKELDVEMIRSKKIDLVFSQACFEHIQPFEDFVKRLSESVLLNTILISEIDLMTHTRGLREKDPLNIYRFSNFIFKTFYFSGIPNRLRPYQYKEIFEKYGWKNIMIKPLIVLKNDQFQKMKKGLSFKFQDSKNEMEILSFVLCATKQ